MAQIVGSRARSTERGAALVELALVLPLLLVVIAGIVDFGLAFQRFEVVANAAREGARLGTKRNYGTGRRQAAGPRLYQAGAGHLDDGDARRGGAGRQHYRHPAQCHCRI